MKRCLLPLCVILLLSVIPNLGHAQILFQVRIIINMGIPISFWCNVMVHLSVWYKLNSCTGFQLGVMEDSRWVVQLLEDQGGRHSQRWRDPRLAPAALPVRCQRRFVMPIILCLFLAYLLFHYYHLHYSDQYINHCSLLIY